MISLGAFGLVRLMREGGASAREVIAAHVARSEAINPLINAIVAPRFADALAEAGRLDHAFTRGKKTARLHGLPITVKECIDVCGMATTGGVVGSAAKRKDRDAAVVRLLRREGPSFSARRIWRSSAGGMRRTTHCSGGRTTPGTSHSPLGGSSGGEAAIVAAGGSALGVGTDSGGSVRVPAHYCGIHAFKPTSGRLADAGSLDTQLLSFQAIVRNQPGLLGRRVEDLSLVYHVLAGERRMQSGAGHGLPGTEGTFDLTGWRIGYYLALGSSRPAPAVASAVLRSVRLLAGLGAEAEEFSPPDPEHAARLFAEVFTLDGGAALRKMLGNSPRSGAVDDALRKAGPPLGRQGVSNLTAACNHYRYEFARAFHKMRISLIVCPPASGTAPPHNTS